MTDRPSDPDITETDDITDVLLLVADEWRGDHLGTLGTPGLRTPHLDGLARDGVTFANHWCQASPCGPSRRSLLTGTEVRTHGQWTNHAPAARPLTTLARAGADVGLDPLLVGYTDTPSPDWDPSTGWSGSLDSVPSEESVGPMLHDPAFHLVRPFFWQLGFPAYRRYLTDRGLGPLNDDMMGIYPTAGRPDTDGLAPGSIPAEHSDTAWLTDAAIDVLDRAAGRPDAGQPDSGRSGGSAGPSPGRTPMLLHVNWLRPHPPLAAPAPYHRLIDPDEVEPPTRARTLDHQIDTHPFFAAAARGRPMAEYLQESRRVETVTEADDRRLRAAYYGLMAEIDHHVGRLVERLKANGRWDSTLVVFLSDHGDALGDHWLYGRRGPFDGHFRVPCLIRDPRSSADATRGRVVDRFTTNLDIMPTILDAIGGPTPPEVEGRSLVDLLEGRPPSNDRDHVRCEMDWTDHGPSGIGRQRFTMIRTARHRYVKFHADPSRPGSDPMPPLLYDLVEDPAETHDRSTDPAMVSILSDLEGLA